MNHFLVCVLGVSLIGCAVDPADDLSETSSTAQDVDSLNGKSLNGTSLSGVTLSGGLLSGTLTRVALNGTSATGGPLVATNGTLPANVVGSKWTGKSSTNVSVALRIDAATAGTGSNADVTFYAVSYQTLLGWVPLCGYDLFGGTTYAVATPGVWTTRGIDAAGYGEANAAFTFACRGKTIAKCIELGYKTTALSPELQACVRALRADYCGDGISHTVDGTLLNLYDDAGVQLDTETWRPEAEWNEGGAACVNSNNSARYQLTTFGEPACVGKLLKPTCGTSFSTGTRVIDELP